MKIKIKFRKIATLTCLVFFALISCTSIDYTNVQREDRIEVELRADSVLIVTDCNTIKYGLPEHINYHIFFPQGFDQNTLHFANECFYEFISSSEILVDFGSLKNMHSYVLFDIVNGQGAFFYFTDMNTYDGRYWFKYGALTKTNEASVEYNLKKNNLELNIEAKFSRPIFKKDDLDMSDSLGDVLHTISGCTTCVNSDSTVKRVVNAEMDYLVKHRGAIKDEPNFRRELLERLNKDNFYNLLY
ncbi:hypothetical protein [Neolewinella agarilytica]|uniref:Lipoprotein n=1 Tax=Neolewinella agarilytica TaxID=478744 RepID=A0A1H9BKU9_9BACT|nr:hypothetical protein [Neolewinella agarilytica]SEP89193.1 hypothetical protein SAMN05444359_103158 [Neolewinella agarilytica]